MKCPLHLPGILMLASVMAGSSAFAEPVKRQESLGPLERFDPRLEKLKGLVATHGNALLGLPAAAGQRMQRMGTEDKWCVETGWYVSVIERNRESGDMELREVIQAEAEWCLSPDGRKFFAMRRHGADIFRQSWECFDFLTGKSLWTAEHGMQISDATFSLDGKSLLVLHPVEAEGDDRTTALSWYDAATGELKRRVKMPGVLYMISGALTTEYIGITGKAVYVTPPREDEVPEGWVIREGSEEPMKLDIDKESSETLANVMVGGAQRELVAIYTEDVLELFREGDGGLTRLWRCDISGSGYPGQSRNVRFSPDHSRLLVSDCEKTLILTTKAADKPVLQTFKSGSVLGDYTADGKFFVTVDDGGGVIRDLHTMERVDKARLREFPAHCCPIEDAGFSIGGNWIVSNDKRSLLLWSKEGEILAELASPNEEVKPRIEMQSPIIVDRLLKVYAADGWDFLEWDLKEIAARRKKLPGFQPRVTGKVVFDDRKAANQEPEVMNVGIDSTGKKLITATRTRFIYRPLDEPEKKTELQVPKRDIFMRPREVQLIDSPARILVTSGSDALDLDPEGKKAAVVLGTGCVGMDVKTKRVFQTVGKSLMARTYGIEGETREEMELPAGWRAHQQFSQLRTTPDGRWVLFLRSSGRMPCLVVVDWTNKKLVRDMPLPWTATTSSLSPDGSRLLLGSANRCVYEFDLKQLCEEGG